MGDLPAWWDIEIEFYISMRGIEPMKARTFTILRWMTMGDLRPLEAAIVEGRELDQAVLNLLADMISGDKSRFGKAPAYRLKAVPTKRGPPKKPELLARGFITSSVYKHARGTGLSSNEAIERICAAIGITDKSARQHLTAFRKALNTK